MISYRDNPGIIGFGVLRAHYLLLAFTAIVSSADGTLRVTRMNRFSSCGFAAVTRGGRAVSGRRRVLPLQQTPFASDFASDYHAPVMSRECIDALLSAASAANGSAGRPVFVDGTLGGGGHSAALLQKLRDNKVRALVIGIDRDPEAIAAATQRLQPYVEDGSFLAIRSNFDNLEVALESHGIPKVDGLLLDLGVSSHQIDVPERGFSFSKDGPLDMRMAQDQQDASSLSAADIVNNNNAKEIQRILSRHGEEPRSKRIAEAIVDHRPLITTRDLVAAVASVVPERAKARRMGRTATLARVFQALRIAVNKEDDALQKVLMKSAPAIVGPGGRLVVMSYHSLEDRVVKQVMKRGYVGRERREIEDQKDVYGNYIGPPRPWKQLGKMVKAAETEVEINSRARSAVLRIAERKTDP